MDGREICAVASAAIGQVLEDHMIANGFMTDEGALPIDEALRQSGVFKAGAGSKIKEREQVAHPAMSKMWRGQFDAPRVATPAPAAHTKCGKSG